jgi:hypothetical protein
MGDTVSQESHSLCLIWSAYSGFPGGTCGPFFRALGLRHGEIPNRPDSPIGVAQARIGIFLEEAGRADDFPRKPASARRGRLKEAQRLSRFAWMAFVLLSGAARARADSAALSGAVTDAAGRPLAGAAIELRNAGSEVVARAVSDPSGRFTLDRVEPGRYALIATKTGFTPTTAPVLFPLPDEPLLLALAPAGSQTITTLETLTVLAPRIAGPGVSASGTGEYAVTTHDIANLPEGENAALTDVLARMPGVAIDQNQQIHIRSTEGPQFQYQIDGVMVPLDINTNPSFLSMINPLFIKQVDLLAGVLPARYSYATGGIVSIETKDGCETPGGSVTLYGGQRDTLQPSVQYGGCAGRLSYHVSALYNQSNAAFSSATPGPDAIHDRTHEGQGLSYFSYAVNPTTKLSAFLSGAGSDNQLPNVPNLPQQFALAGASAPPSSSVNSYLDFRDFLAIVALNRTPRPDLSYGLAYSAHALSEHFKPDNRGELVYQGVASTASHDDFDHTLQGDLTWKRGVHTLGAGFYLGVYRVRADDSSLVFPLDPVTQTPAASPVSILSNARATNVVGGLYLNDLWQIDGKLRANLGLRLDTLTGFTSHHQINPTVNLSHSLNPETTLHGGFARYLQVPSFQGISPTASAAFANTTAAGSPGVATPLTEDDLEWDVGVVHHFTHALILSEDNYYEITNRYLDTGQFGIVPLFAPFNYAHGSIWGSEVALNDQGRSLSWYFNLTLGRNLQKGVLTGQFNFPPDELAYIDSHSIVLDHQPSYGVTSGATFERRPYSISVDVVFSTGLRAGFADQQKLPHVMQVNLSAERRFRIPILGDVTERLLILNVFDRVNLIRPAHGIGIFQSAYGPRLTLLNALTIRF